MSTVQQGPVSHLLHRGVNFNKTLAGGCPRRGSAWSATARMYSNLLSWWNRRACVSPNPISCQTRSQVQAKPASSPRWKMVKSLFGIKNILVIFKHFQKFHGFSSIAPTKNIQKPTPKALHGTEEHLELLRSLPTIMKGLGTLIHPYLNVSPIHTLNAYFS